MAGLRCSALTIRSWTSPLSAMPIVCARAREVVTVRPPEEARRPAMQIEPVESSRMLAFFPWFAVRTRIEIGEFALEPWEQESGPDWVR